MVWPFLRRGVLKPIIAELHSEIVRDTSDPAWTRKLHRPRN
jgi:hypothetical protein